MFYDRFHELCIQKGVTPTQVGRDVGIRQSTISMWKKQGTHPGAENIAKLANYFDVPADSLLGKKLSNAETAIVLARLLNEFRNDPEAKQRMLNVASDFARKKNKPKIDIEKDIGMLIDLFLALGDENGGDDAKEEQP